MKNGDEYAIAVQAKHGDRAIFRIPPQPVSPSKGLAECFGGLGRLTSESFDEPLERMTCEACRAVISLSRRWFGHRCGCRRIETEDRAARLTSLENGYRLSEWDSTLPVAAHSTPCRSHS